MQFAFAVHAIDVGRGTENGENSGSHRVRIQFREHVVLANFTLSQSPSWRRRSVTVFAITGDVITVQCVTMHITSCFARCTSGLCPYLIVVIGVCNFLEVEAYMCVVFGCQSIDRREETHNLSSRGRKKCGISWDTSTGDVSKKVFARRVGSILTLAESSRLCPADRADQVVCHEGALNDRLWFILEGADTHANSLPRRSANQHILGIACRHMLCYRTNILALPQCRPFEHQLSLHGHAQQCRRHARATHDSNAVL